MTQRRFRELTPLRGRMWIVPCILLWSIFPKLASHTGNLDVFGLLFWSSAVSASGLLVCTWCMGQWPVLRAYSATDIRRIAALAALGAFASCALLYLAYLPCRAAACGEQRAAIILLHYAWPALAVLWSAVLLREQLTWRIAASQIVSLMAVAIGVGVTTPGPDLMAKLAFVGLGAIAFGLYSTLLKRVTYEACSSMAVGFSVATVLAFLTSAQFSKKLVVPDGAAAWTVLINGVFVNGLSYVCWFRALRAAPIGRVAPWILLAPILAAVIDRRPAPIEPHHLIGIGLVLAAGLLARETAPRRLLGGHVAQDPTLSGLAEESR